MARIVGRRGVERRGVERRGIERWVDHGVAGPGLVVGRVGEVDEVVLGPQLRADPVDASGDPFGPALLVLVAEGVGQRLDGAGAVDDAAVAVQPGVDLDQGQFAVAAEDGEAGLAEDDAADRPGRRAGRGEGAAAQGRRATAALPGDGRPEGVAHLLELTPDRHPLLGGRDHRFVERVEAGEEVVAADLET